MAIVNLGSIKFNWKGAYAGGTAYAVDDVVSYNGSSYVCTAASTGNLPTDTNFWDQMSSAGTDGTNGADGTDLTTTLTTQGDLVYRDGSGLQRLAKGTAGQALLMNSGATAPEWGTGGEKNTPVVIAYLDGTQSFSSNAIVKITYDTTSVNTDNVFNTTTHTFTPNVAGYYYIKAQFGGGSYTGATHIMAKINGSTNYYLKDEYVESSYIESGLDTIYFNGTTDYAEFYGYFANGRTISGSSTNGATKLQIFRIII
jgi:hypothetical protein